MRSLGASDLLYEISAVPEKVEGNSVLIVSLYEMGLAQSQRAPSFHPSLSFTHSTVISGAAQKKEAANMKRPNSLLPHKLANKSAQECLRFRWRRKESKLCYVTFSISGCVLSLSPCGMNAAKDQSRFRQLRIFRLIKPGEHRVQHAHVHACTLVVLVCHIRVFAHNGCQLCLSFQTGEIDSTRGENYRTIGYRKSSRFVESLSSYLGCY